MNRIEKIRVILANSHDIFRGSVSASLKLDEGIAVVGEATNGKELLTLCSKEQPDVVVVDAHMPAMYGIEASRQIKDKLPGVRILVLTAFDDDEYLLALINMVIDGYLLRSSADIVLANAIKSVYLGINMLDRSLAHKIRSLLAAKPRNGLTKTEERVAKLMAEGHYNKDIARELNISYGRARNIVSDIYRKLGISERTKILEKLNIR